MMARYFITVVLFRAILFDDVLGTIQNGLYNVDIGVEVNTFYETTRMPSVIRCAMRCNTSISCQTATFDVGTEECLLSVDTRMYAIDTGNPNRKTISLVQDNPICVVPPLIANGLLVITSTTPPDATASLQCNPGYVIAPTSPLTVNCIEGTGWGDISGMLCQTLPVDPRGYHGTSFILGFMQNGESNSGTPNLLFACKATANVRVEIPFLLIDEIHVVSTSLSVSYANSVTSATSGIIEQKVIYITSDVPIIVYSYNFDSGSSDGTLILPTTKLSTEYFIAGHPSTLAGTDEVLLIGHYDATSVTIEYSSNIQETITLNQNQTFLKQSVDMSGTRITSTQPLFVMSGHSCANIPDNSVIYCDYIDEVTPPLTSLGTTHIVSYMTPRPDFTINIVILVDMTTVRFYLGSGTIWETLTSLPAKTSIFRTYTVSKTIVIISDQNIMVHQFGHGSQSTSGDPSMMFIPDIGHYGDLYEFTVPTTSTLPTLTIVIDNIYPASDLKLNGQNFNPVSVIPVTVEGIAFTVLYVEIPTGFNTLTHGSGTARFGAWLYGRTSIIEYAWTLGYAV
ncbi:hypothetical protein ACF0H5_021068 [Mactra antiquata]